MINKTNEKEIWKIIDYKNIKSDMYSVSNYGNIKNIKTDQMLHPWKGKNGYLYVSLMTTENTVFKISMHVLVAIYFVKIPKRLAKLNEPIVPNHDDFDKTNNYYKNLTWMTYAMNNEWNRIHDHWKIGEEAPNAKVDNDQVHKICKLMESGYLNRDIVKLLELPKDDYTKALLTRIRTGKEWKSISSQYNIINKNTLRKNDEKFVEDICKLIEKGYSVSDMRKILELSTNPKDKRRFKSLVWAIRKRKSYKDISEKYSW